MFVYGFFILAAIIGIVVAYRYLFTGSLKVLAIKSSGSAASEAVVGQGADSEITQTQPLPEGVSMIPPKTAAAQQPLFKDGQVSMGSIIPRTGEFGALGASLTDGIFLGLNKVNTIEGGIRKKYRVALDQRDDGSDILRASVHMYDLIAKSQLFLLPLGDVTFEKVLLPLAAQGKAALVFPCTGMRPKIADELPVIWLRPPYRQEVAALLDYAVNNLKQTKIALFYEDSGWSIKIKEEVEATLKRKYNLTLTGASSYEPKTVAADDAVREIKKSNPQVILMASTARAAYGFIREAINQQLHYCSFLGISRTASVAPQLKASRGITLVTSSVVPNPYNSPVPVVKQYRTFMQQYLPNKDLSEESLEGFLSVSLLAYFMRKIAAPEPTVGDLLSVIAREGKNLLFKGIPLKYLDKTLSWTVWLNTGIDTEWNTYTGAA